MLWNGRLCYATRIHGSKKRTWVYSIASSVPFPLLFAVNNTQNTLHHLYDIRHQTHEIKWHSLKQQSLFCIYGGLRVDRDICFIR